MRLGSQAKEAALLILQKKYLYFVKGKKKLHVNLIYCMILIFLWGSHL
jgi:hypothetical protein